MDAIRTGYKCKIKPYHDSNEEVDITWYRAAPGAKIFPKYHKFASGNYANHSPWTGIGEVEGTRTYYKGQMPGFFSGQYYCGDYDMFLNGASINDAPLLKLTNGQPACCLATPGGWFWGGSADATKINIYSPNISGSVQLTGYEYPVANYNYNPSGYITTSGVILPLLGFLVVVNINLQLGWCKPGLIPFQGLRLIPIGGFLLFGLLNPKKGNKANPAGNAVLGGVIAPLKGNKANPAGNAVLGGVIAPLKGMNNNLAGGVVLGGGVVLAMPCPSSIACDTFTVAGSTSIDGKTLDKQTTMSWVLDNGTLTVSGGKVSGSTVNTECYAHVAVGASNVTVSADIVGSATTSSPGLIARLTDASNYLLVGADYANHNIYMFKRVSGSFSVIAGPASYTFSAGTSYNWQFVVSGSSLTGKINGTSVITGSDSFNSSATRHGIRDFLNAPGGNASNFDNFTVS